MTQVATSKKGVQELLNSPNIQKKLEEILGKRASVFATSVVQITQSNAMLATAEPQSIIGAAMTAATLNLPLNNNLGLAWIVPFREKQKDGSYLVKAQFQIGYKGFMQLAMRSGQFVRMNTSDVREGELKFRDILTGELEFETIQDHKERSGKKIIGYVSYFELKNGFKSFYYMTAEEVEAHAKRYSQSYKKGYGIWKDDKEKMSLKTVSKLHLNGGQAPLSIEMQGAIQADQAVVNIDETSGEITEDIAYIDNEVVEVDPDLERMTMLVNDIKNQEDIDFARGCVTDKALIAQIDLKEVQLKKPAKK